MATERLWKFFVAGTPATQGSKRAFVNKHSGKPVLVDDTGDKLKLWRHSVNDEARKLWGGKEALAGPVHLGIRFQLRKPKKPKKGVTQPIGKLSGDLDKLSRAVFDALTEVIFQDDSQVIMLNVMKTWAEPVGAWVEILEIR